MTTCSTTTNVNMNTHANAGQNSLSLRKTKHLDSGRQKSSYAPNVAPSSANQEKLNSQQDLLTEVTNMKRVLKYAKVTSWIIALATPIIIYGVYQWAISL